MPYETQTVPKFGSKVHIANLQSEKEKVIQELLAVKDENQKLHLQLKHKDCEIQSLKKEIELSNLKLVENTKEISNLKRDKALHSAKIKQIESNACHMKISPKKNVSESDSDEEYEVECIESHKIYRGERQFYVKWKGYAQDHDCWVKEKDLKCPIILTAYLEQHNLRMEPAINKRTQR